MNTLLHRDEDDSFEQGTDGANREITLGPTVLLGIFFALAVVCAVFFGFGYSMGRKASVTSATITSGGNALPTSFAGFKPAAGNPFGSGGESRPMQAASAPVIYTPPAASLPTRTAEPPQATAVSKAAEETAPGPAAAAASSPSAPGAIPTGGAIMVQIAAVSHQEDADLLMTTLKRRGYAVALHSEPQDKLLHVQVGPFPTHKDADAMRQRLLADGFNAIVKEPAK